jgi:imidazole glycerol-phosphate synthase subunit HisH
MKSSTIQLIDAGTGNLQSVYNALQNLGATISVISETTECRKDVKTILPGVGAFHQFMDGLVQRNLVDPITQIVHSEIPLLGICVGMQALFEFSEEMVHTPGLGIIPGSVLRFPDQKGNKIPHTGWNEISFSNPSTLLNAIETGSYFYFNHSYYCQTRLPAQSLTITDYILPFTSSVESRNVFGVQFHPEKSQKLGQQLLCNFLSL